MSERLQRLPWPAVARAVESLGMVYPRGFAPWDRGGDDAPIETAAEWRARRWNPPHFAAELVDKAGVDAAVKIREPGASSKPTWAAILAEWRLIEWHDAATALLQETHAEAERRITAAYGAGDAIQEIRLRLASTIPAGDTERARLVAAYAALKRRLWPASHASVSHLAPPRADPNSPSLATLRTLSPTTALTP